MNENNNISRVIKGIKFITIVVILLVSVSINAQTNVPGSQAQVGSASQTANLPAAYPSGTSINYIRIWDPRIPMTDPNAVVSATDVNQVNHSTQYIDGLGRSLQLVSWQGSPGKTDIVAPVLYDALGRVQYKYLPYNSSDNGGGLKANPFGDQNSFYSSTYPAQQPALKGEQFFYSKTNFEASPLNRVQKAFAPGNSWAGSEGSATEHAVNMQYLVNNTNDLVQLWTITTNGLTYNNNDVNINIPTTTSTYAAGTLYKTVTIDEAGHAVVEYKDLEGHVILKKVQIGNAIPADYTGQDGNWLCTYYIYDDFGLLRFVIPPKATSILAAGSWVLDVITINELCFRYEYDYRKRMKAKKVPGAGWVFMIYDQRDRLVFTQDANMGGNGQWFYTLYDGLNRPVQTGIMAGYSGSPDNLQAYVTANTTGSDSSTITTTGSGASNLSIPVDADYSTRNVSISDYQATNSITFDNNFTSEDNAQFVAEIVSGSSTGFSTSSTVVATPIPTSGTTQIPLTLHFYDNYSQTTKGYNTANNSKLDAGNNSYADPLQGSQSTMTQGLPTVSRVRVIENPANLTLGNWIETASFYDDKGRVIQTQSDNYKGGLETATMLYDFSNKPITSYQTHTNPAAQTSISVKTNMDFDWAERLLAVRKTLNDDATHTRTITQNSYDALGQLKTKKLASKPVAVVG